MEQQLDPTDALIQVANGQETLVAHLVAVQSKEEEVDPESRMRLRSIDVQMLKILEEISAGRQESMAQIHADLTQVNTAVQELSASKGKG